MISKKGLRRLAVVLTLTALVGAGAISAATGDDARGRGRGLTDPLAGTWIGTVNRPAPLPALKSFQVFTSDGSVIEMASEAQALRSASYGSWEPLGGGLYAATMVFFRFDAQGTWLGTQKINRTIRLAPDGQTFSHVARVTTLDVNGNVLASFRAVASAERMAVERIPDQP
jgi:hypothetical protein